VGRAKDQVLYYYTIYYFLIICFILSSLGCSTGGFIVHNWLSNLFMVSIINFNIIFTTAPPGST